MILIPQSLNTFMTFFFTFSVSGPDKPFNIARTSSLYNPTEWCSKLDLIAVKCSYRLIRIPLRHRSNPSEHQSSHLPPFLPIHGMPSLNNVIFLACIVKFISSSEISVICFADWMALINKFSLIER